MDEAKLLELMLSWERGYIAPSAQIVFRDARLLIEEKNEVIRRLEEELAATNAPAPGPSVVDVSANGVDDSQKELFVDDVPKTRPRRGAK